MMVGGEKAAVDRLDPILKTLAPGLGDMPRTKRSAGADPRAELGYMHAGPAGRRPLRQDGPQRHRVRPDAGLRRGLRRAAGQGLGASCPKADRFDLNLADIAEVWRRGSVISSWLLDLTAQALAGDPKLAKYTGEVAD